MLLNDTEVARCHQHVTCQERRSIGRSSVISMLFEAHQRHHVWNEHGFRRRRRRNQYVTLHKKQRAMQGNCLSVDKPIDLYNCHSPSSKKHPLISTVRKDILSWFLHNTGSQALIGGDLNSKSRAWMTALRVTLLFTTATNLATVTVMWPLRKVFERRARHAR